MPEEERERGTVRLYLDGKPLGGPVDLYNPDVVPTGELPFGAHDLAAGEHGLAVEIAGANERAVKAYMFGLDYVKVRPVAERP